ncbi:hypothetical protein SDC9_36806 [bioreactor metagenome]|jgi:hypothetical protein|uniref:Uncharacterized protein n=1 Tax=bioreactor metagenome TaxID=1076179 RepID=A0A644VHL5_9ZZZZ|nr:hypothetical protein [Paludibacter sp.]
MKKLFLILVVSLSILQLKSQIHFGDDAATVEAILKFGRKYPHLSYANGKIEYIYHCEKGRYAHDFKKYINYCDYYIMDANERYVCYLRQFENISIEELESLYNEFYVERKFGNYYFNKDFDIYYELYLADNNLATTRSKKVVLSNFNSKIRSWIEKKQEEVFIEKQKQLELEQENERKIKAKEDSIKSAIFDLKINSYPTYRRFTENLSLKIKNELSNNDLFAFQIISKSKLKKNRFTSEYNLQYGYIKDEKSEDFEYFESIVFIRGNDEEIQSLKNVNLPPIYINKIEAHTEAKFENIKIDFVRGITKVKIRNGEIVYRKGIPDEDIKEVLSKQLKEKENGLYFVRYEVSDILGVRDVNIISEEIENRTIKFLVGLGIVALLLAI